MGDLTGGRQRWVAHAENRERFEDAGVEGHSAMATSRRMSAVTPKPGEARGRCSVKSSQASKATPTL